MANPDLPVVRQPVLCTILTRLCQCGFLASATTVEHVHEAFQEHAMFKWKVDGELHQSARKKEEIP